MATYSWTSDADQDATILRARTESNLAATESIGAPAGSTQAECDAIIAAANAEVPPRLVGVTVKIFDTDQSWVRASIRDEVRRVKRLHKTADRITFDAALAEADQATLDAVAAVLGLPGGTLGLRPVKA